MPNVDLDTLRVRVEALIDQGDAVPRLPAQKQAYGRAGTWVEVRQYAAWQARATALVHGALPANHT